MSSSPSYESVYAKASSRRRDIAAVSAILVLAGLYFAVLELREPFYFLWDDNASFFLPCYVYNHDSVIGRGELPHLNYHQYLGHTYLASGQTAVLYPPLYLGLALTRLGWGDLRAVIDVLAVLHFLAAALGMYFLLRRFAVRPVSAVAVALLWMSSPFLVVVTRSWIFVAYAAALLPWGLWALERLLERPSAPRVFAVATVKALFLYQGYVQYAVLATLFEGLYVLLRWLAGADLRAQWKRHAAAYAGALAAAAALAAPVLFPMLHAKQVSAYRTGSLSFEEFISNALDLGTFFSAQLFQFEPRALHLSTGAIFYVGIPNLLALAALVRARRRRPFLLALGVALTALVLSTKAFGIMYHLPVLSSFRWPFKSYLIVLAFLAIPLAGGYDVWLSARRRAVRAIGALLLAAALTGNLAIVFSKTLDAPFGPNRLRDNVATLRAEAAQLIPLEHGRVVSMWMSPLEPDIHRLLPLQLRDTGRRVPHGWLRSADRGRKPEAGASPRVFEHLSLRAYARATRLPELLERALLHRAEKLDVSADRSPASGLGAIPAITPQLRGRSHRDLGKRCGIAVCVFRRPAA